MKNLTFEDLPMALEVALEKLARIEEELYAIKENFQPKIPEELMTRKEVADYFKISLTTLWDWSKKGILINYSIGNRVYYKRSEIDKRLQKTI